MTASPRIRRADGLSRVLGLAAAFLPGLIALPAASVATADPVLTWNDQTNRAIQVTRTDPFNASRDLALESVAVFDTMRSLSGLPGVLVRLPGPHGIPARVAIAASAHAMLTRLFPERRADLDATFTAALAREPAGSARESAVAFGEAIANAVYAVRDGDGWNKVSDAAPGTGIGRWRPTPAGFLPALTPQWATLTPFLLREPAQFRPPGPPALDSSAFRDATATVKSLGAAGSAQRTANQTEIAHYWSDAIGTYAPAGHWNAIAATLAAPAHLGLAEEAELFVELNLAIADSGVAVADAKYTYWFWRPVTVIRTGGDGLAPRPDWTPLLETPNHPSYISGHSGFSAAAAVILTARFGDRPFSFESASVPGVTRAFTGFQQAAEEAAASRVYGGIHFPFDNADGLATGKKVGEWTMNAFRQIAEDRGPVVLIDPVKGGPDPGVPGPHAVSGFAVDNAAPVHTVTVTVNGGAPFRVAVDDLGRFTIPRQRTGSMGRHELVVTAASPSGHVTTAHRTIDGIGDTGVNSAPLTVH